MAPELISGKTGYDTKVDIWSFGILAMELTNGDPPYIYEHQAAALRKIVENDTPPIKEKWSPLFQDFVSKCLVKDPNERPNADQLLEHEFLAGAADYKQEFAKVVKDYKKVKLAKNKVKE